MKIESTQVALVSCPDYEDTALEQHVQTLMSCLDYQGTLQSSSVLLKPNLITGSHGILPCTEPAFILAVARWFVDHGARVTIGDSPVFGTARSTLEKIGVSRQLHALGVRMINFNQAAKVLPGGAENPGLASEVFECDLLVNLPRVKAHAQTRVTMAVKNYFGCLVGLRKPWWHMAHGGACGNFADRLVYLLDMLPNSITLMDGITAMARTGPVHGDAYPLGILASSCNPVAVDRAMHRILDLDPVESPLMQACQRQQLPGAKLVDLIFPLSTPEELLVHDFLIPATLHPIRFNPFRFVRSTMKRLFLRLLPS